VIRVKHLFQMVSFYVRLWPKDSFSDYGRAFISVIRVKPLFQMVSFLVRLGVAFGSQCCDWG